MALKDASNLDTLLKEAMDLGATDLHIVVGAKPKCRVRGELIELDYAVLTSKVADKLIYPLLDALARSRLNTDGQWDMGYQILGGTLLENGVVCKDTCRFRVNIFKQKGALAGIFRILANNIPNYTSLGLPYNIFSLYRKRRGMVLVTGATGSGKSTTLATMVDLINENLRKHIITLENPIEYLHWHKRSNVCQREIGVDVDSFENGLRSALREDPDVILVGEMRDLETVDIALTSAETGHLVYSTLHTMGSADTINRIINMYPESQHNQVRSILVSVLEAVISQQLLPRKDGKGYVVAYEFMQRNKTIQEYIRLGRVDKITEYLKSDDAKEDGMCDMDTTIYNLYQKGLIAKDVAIDYAFDRKEMMNKLM